MAYGMTRLGFLSGGGAIPDRSLDFEQSSSQYLSMSDTNFGAFDRNKGTISVWVKKESSSSLSTQGALLSQFASGNMCFAVGFEGTGKIAMDVSTNGAIATNNGRLATTATYSNGIWYHIKFLYDMQNATAANRLRIWVDGTEIASFSDRTNPPQTSLYNSTADIRIGSNQENGTHHDGLLYQIAYFSGVDVPIGQLISGGNPLDVKGISGLYSLLNTNAGGALEDDYVLSTNWTNNNTVIKSTEVP